MNLVYGVRRVKQAGYLLIEMIIALAIVATMSIILACIHVSMIHWHKQAVQYATATNLALTTLALLQNQKTKPPLANGFTIKIDSKAIDPSIPFMLHTITVSFKTPYGREKHVTITGGALHALS